MEGERQISQRDTAAGRAVAERRERARRDDEREGRDQEKRHQVDAAPFLPNRDHVLEVGIAVALAHPGRESEHTQFLGRRRIEAYSAEVVVATARVDVGAEDGRILAQATALAATEEHRD